MVVDVARDRRWDEVADRATRRDPSPDRRRRETEPGTLQEVDAVRTSRELRLEPRALWSGVPLARHAGDPRGIQEPLGFPPRRQVVEGLGREDEGEIRLMAR